LKKLVYYFFRGWISLGLFCYYRKINVNGLENIPKNKPVLFLSNHQNALIDALLIATQCSRKPWFLTRSDVFANTFFKTLFGFLQMLPIYRIRDGRNKLSKNHAIFDQCAELLIQNKAIAIFPEANHSLKRRVRPLSKGFTRIIDNALHQNPNLDLQLVPVGQNYKRPLQVGDSAALYFGKPISVRDLVENLEGNLVSAMKTRVFEQLKQLTTHIEDETNYDTVIERLNGANVDFLNPKGVNKMVLDKSFSKGKEIPLVSVDPNRFFFYLINLPVVFLWRLLLKPRVPEPEFMATFRFAFSMLIYPLFYLIWFLTLQYTFSVSISLGIVFAHGIVNLFLVKMELNY